MKKKMLLTSLFNVTNEHAYYTELLRKYTSFLPLFMDKYDFYVLDLEMFNDADILSSYLSPHTKSTFRSFVTDLNNFVPIKGVVNASIYDKFNKIKENKSLDQIPSMEFGSKEQFDVIYSFNNYIDPGFNRIACQKKLRYKDIQLLSKYKNPEYFDFILYRYVTFLMLNETFKLLNAVKLELISDPLDLRYDNFTYLLPDIPVSTEIDNTPFDYFPFYQFYYFIFTQPVKRQKEHLFVVGSTLYDKWRQDLFEKYLSDIFKSEVDNSQYKWYLTGTLNGKPYNSFINPDKFNEEIEKSRYGLVLNTYAKDIISTNKISNYISRQCVPIICEGSDEKSGFFPKKLLGQIEIKSCDDLRFFLSKSNYFELNETIQNEFAYYYDIDYYRNVFSKYF
jgi:hypothetical protein